MKCPDCLIDCKVYKQINRSGSVVVVERCPVCKGNPSPQRAFLPKKDYNVDELPLFEDYTITAHKCDVKGCTNKGVEYHHFAPRHLWANADDWPTGWLCIEHHREWHKKTKTGIYAQRIYGN